MAKANQTKISDPKRFNKIKKILSDLRRDCVDEIANNKFIRIAGYVISDCSFLVAELDRLTGGAVEEEVVEEEELIEA